MTRVPKPKTLNPKPTPYPTPLPPCCRSGMVADLGLKPTIGVRPVLLARCFGFEGLGVHTVDATTPT